MIIVYMDTMEDTSTFKPIYEGLDCKLLYNPSREEVTRVLKENPTETLLCFGHGSPFGLYSPNIEEFNVIDQYTVPLLKGREVIGIWCYASEFAKKHNLKGFFTYMFISNEDEASSLRYEGYDNSTIYQRNALFAKRINQLIKDGIPLSEWVERLQSEYDKKLGFEEFNYLNLEYFDNE